MHGFSAGGARWSNQHSIVRFLMRLEISQHFNEPQLALKCDITAALKAGTKLVNHNPYIEKF